MAESARLLALEKLKSSGLDERDLKRLRMEPLSARAVRKLCPVFQDRPGLKIPYFTIDGKPREFYRLRYLGPAPSAFGEDQTKAPRYVQPPESGAAAYFPPLIDWKRATAPGHPLFLTEGELKAGRACKLALPVIGLGGVFNFQSTQLGKAFLPELEAIDWHKRPVNIVFDSDYLINANIRLALQRLMNLLIQRGAMPRVVTLPALEGLAKTGLDDFLVREPIEAFREVVENATGSDEARTLWEWNEKFAHILDPPMIVDQRTGQRMRARDFEEDVYRNHHIHVLVVKPDGSETFKQVKTATRWLDWEHHTQLERVTYAPGKPRIFDNQFNLWKGWGVESKRGDVTMWKKLLQFIFPDEAARTWFERWAAYPIKYPGTKLFTAVVIWSLAHGVGKSIIGETLGTIYGDNFSLIGQEELESPYNEWGHGKQFVLGDDVTGSDNRTYEGKLKKMITQPSVRINQKYVPTFSIPDYANYLFTAQKSNAFIVDPEDRRYMITHAPEVPMEMDFYKAFVAWRDQQEGASALRHHLEHLDTRGFDPHAPAPMTQAKQQAIEESRTDAGVWLEELKTNLHQSLLPDLVTSQQVLSEYERQTGRTRLTVNGIAREMTKAGFVKANEDSNIYPHEKGARYWIIRNLDRWLLASASECRDYLESMTMPEEREKKY